MRLIIAGSRTFEDPEKDYNLVVRALDQASGHLPVPPQKADVIVSGAAPGVDRLGEIFAGEHKIRLKQFPADWKTNGKSAGYIRNYQMAKYATACVVVWDGKSSGSLHMAKTAVNLKTPCVLVDLSDRTEPLLVIGENILNL